MQLKCFFSTRQVTQVKYLWTDPRPLTSYFKLLQVAIVLGTVEKQPSLAFGALDEPVRRQELLHHTSLSYARPCAVGVCSVSIVMEHTWVKTHLRERRGQWLKYIQVEDKHEADQILKIKVESCSLMQCLMPTVTQNTLNMQVQQTTEEVGRGEKKQK